MKKARLISLLLAMLIAGNLMASCGNDSGTTNDTTDAQTGTESESIEESTGPSFPEMDMDGKEFTIFVEGWASFDPLSINDIMAEELTGDSLNDAIYNRNVKVEKQYNCKVSFLEVGDTIAAHNQLKQSVMAADQSYDIAIIRTYNYLSAITNGLVMDISDIPNTDHTQPWWNQNSLDSLSVGGKAYAICSDITMNDEKSIWCVFFNKKMIDDYNLDDPNKLVADSTWTYDKLFTMAETVSADLDGNDKRDEKDRYGIGYIGDSSTPICMSVGIKIAEKNNEDLPEFSFDKGENISRYLEIFTKLYNDDIAYDWHTRQGFAGETDIFTNSQALFCLGGVYYASLLRDMKDDFGIIPYPKYDETQTEYISSASSNFLSVCAVPVTNDDLENTGAFMEYYAYLGYTDIRPQFYDVLLQGKVARDDESVKMLDTLVGTVTYDLGGIFDFGRFGSEILEMCKKEDLNIASKVEKKRKSINNDIDKLIKAINETE